VDEAPRRSPRAAPRRPRARRPRPHGSIAGRPFRPSASSALAVASRPSSGPPSTPSTAFSTTLSVCADAPCCWTMPTPPRAPRSDPSARPRPRCGDSSASPHPAHHAGEDLDERALPGPVLAHQRVHGPRAHGEPRPPGGPRARRTAWSARVDHRRGLRAHRSGTWIVPATISADRARTRVTTSIGNRWRLRSSATKPTPFSASPSSRSPPRNSFASQPA